MARPPDWGNGSDDEGGGSSQLTSRAPPTEEETRQEGRELFGHFLQQDLMRRGISDASSMIRNYIQNQPNGPSGDASHFGATQMTRAPQVAQPIPSTSTDVRDGGAEIGIPRYSNPEWERIGQTMDVLMQRFEQSSYRREVQHLANSVSINNINRDAFMSFLLNYLTNGKNFKLRIIGLFFFCSDIIVRAIREVAVDYGKKFLEWSMCFIMEKITTWVMERGGWAAVFQVHAPTIIISFVCGMLGMATILFLSRWWSK